MRGNLAGILEGHKARAGQTYRLGIVNMGGTLICLPNDEGMLAPVQTERELMDILRDGADLASLVDQDLLKLGIVYHHPVDSSQMLDTDREPVLQPLHDAYRHFDGFVVIHGTDTAAETSRFLHLTLPHYDPVEYHRSGRIVSNWTKPVAVVSSQEPAATTRGDQLIPNPGSDADVNLVTALMLLCEGKVGEVGMITNGYETLRGVTSWKATESRIPPFLSDPGVPAIGTRTAFKTSYTAVDYLGFRSDSRLATVVTGSDQYERRALVVQEDAHLNSCRVYLTAKEQGNDAVVSALQDQLPRVILYGSRGAGNVQKEHYDVLKKMEQEGVFVARVPLRGGRVPAGMHYDVPGGDLVGANIEAQTARYKAQVCLALADRLKVPVGDQPAFLSKMFSFQFGAEVLPME
jgi:L-asparaginase/Glu-tRNA(Gln) amidotransferase subunit D